MYIRLHDIADTVQDLRQTARLLVKPDLAALDAAHIQNVIDQAQQMIPRRHDLLEIFFHPLPVINMLHRQRSESYDRIHRRPDIVRHIGEEYALGLARPVGLHQRILQVASLLHLIADFFIHTADTQDNTAAAAANPGPHDLHLIILQLAFLLRTEIHMILFALGQPLLYLLSGSCLPHHLAVFLTDILLYIKFHALFERKLSCKILFELLAYFLHAQRLPDPRLQIKKADHLIVYAQRLHKLHLLPLILFLLQLPVRTVQNKALIPQLVILPHQLYVPHHIPDRPVLTAHTVFHADTVSFFLQSPDFLQQLFTVFLHNGRCNHVKSVLRHLIQGIISQNIQRRLIHADDLGSVHTVVHDTALDIVKDRLQCAVLLYDLLLIGPFLCHVDGHAHSAHHTSVDIIQRRFVSRKKPDTVPGLHALFGDKSLFLLHDLTFRLDTGRIVLLHIPDIGVPLAFHLLLRLAYRPAEAVVYLLMHTVFVLVPDEVRNIIDRSFQKMTGLPVILAHLVSLLPSQEMEPDLLPGHRQRPDILHPVQHPG